MLEFPEIVPRYDKPFTAMTMPFIKSLLESEKTGYFFEGECSFTMTDIPVPVRLFIESNKFEKAKALLLEHDLI